MLKLPIIGVFGPAYIATTTIIIVSDITWSRIPCAGRVFLAIAWCHCGGSTFNSTTVDVVFCCCRRCCGWDCRNIYSCSIMDLT